MATWRKLISEEMEMWGDTWSNVESCTLSDADLDAEFDENYGVQKGKPFTVWTKYRVYFPGLFDGSEWAASVARHPDGEPTDHVGGGGRR